MRAKAAARNEAQCSERPPRQHGSSQEPQDSRPHAKAFQSLKRKAGDQQKGAPVAGSPPQRPTLREAGPIPASPHVQSWESAWRGRMSALLPFRRFLSPISFSCSSAPSRSICAEYRSLPEVPRRVQLGARRNPANSCAGRLTTSTSQKVPERESVGINNDFTWNSFISGDCVHCTEFMSGPSSLSKLPGLAVSRTLPWRAMLAQDVSCCLR